MPTPKDDGSILRSSLMGSFMRRARLIAERQPMSIAGSSLTASALADHTDAPASHTNVNSTALATVSPTPPLRSRQIAKEPAKNDAVSLPPQPLPIAAGHQPATVAAVVVAIGAAGLAGAAGERAASRSTRACRGPWSSRIDRGWPTRRAVL